MGIDGGDGKLIDILIHSVRNMNMNWRPVAVIDIIDIDAYWDKQGVVR